MGVVRMNTSRSEPIIIDGAEDEVTGQLLHCIHHGVGQVWAPVGQRDFNYVAFTLFLRKN